MLTATVFLPAVGALVLLLVNGDKNIRGVAVAVAVADMVLSLIVFGAFNRGADADRFQFVDKFEWIPDVGLNANYLLAVDGLSAPLVALTGLLGICAVLASWHVKLRVREYFIWLLLLQTAVMGVFTSLDLLLFFLFWELELVPMFMLISVWGSGRKEYSAMKFLIFTILGSAFMLVGIVAVYLTPGVGTFNMIELSTQATMLTSAGLLIPLSGLFWLFFAGFAIKLPTWPVHTWLPDAHTDAPTAASVMLAGVLLKMGGYGLLRINVGMFPTQTDRFAWALVALGVVSVLYGAVVTMRQTDLKRLIAYSSVSHMGLVLVGIGSVGVSQGALSVTGLSGAAMQLFTHGTVTGLLFLAVGLVYEKTHTRYIPDLGGLAGRMPVVAAAMLIAGLASLGLPGLSGFVSELLVFLGAYQAYDWPTVLAVLGIVLAAGYILWMMERTFFGPRRERFADLTDASLVEAMPLVLMVVTIIGVGVWPSILTDVFESGLDPMVEMLNGVIAK
ncbi:MAG: NADH-quinone oxidoreductase subunit M [SAR202 cluster bacterium]|nr:oxidoreductase [Chloroflexota bacterium]MQF96589.1 NADH-quinone oxidoreductase subunit M [SAR202 cluster bacterium]HAA94390.1 oxidoreductase [Dehalococcoidia bacterium]MQG33774.1 NADH-quinone oxidoreductase subunit M [SAR202 cluster bacterium]HCL26477.1 oxidoreductase [Dehalococcoidia bacterium]